ncbi:putative membrane protein [Stella humosa]|uniref:Putative membrane protein n=1 Tax=Stella humosa TaxID=94 RepID=A0A3N1ME47_9PROT|nr:DUF2254 domain-containing protein [Stella humosa]ROQ01838.1 putative membrane protein [Stella humosa]BBK32226.1 hypothetical protein STHU_28600 [Stella humosa]
MRSQVRQLLVDLAESFWLLPALIVALGLALGEGLVDLERSGLIPAWLLDGWLYSGGGAGARTLLGAVAASTIGVAGTIFSITIASLTLASSQMGPRLLSNFTRDRGNQATLGVFLGTFAFSLIVLRAVRGSDEGAFVPHLAVTVSISLAFLCIAMLVYFVHHMATRINVDTVIDLVHAELRQSISRLTTEEAGPDETAPSWAAADRACHPLQGYLQQLDDAWLADWARDKGVDLRLTVRPGHYVFPGTTVLESSQPVAGLEQALVTATAVGGRRVATADLEFAIRQLADIAIRALSPGINDPQTANAVLDRLGAGLCELAGRHLPNGMFRRDGRVVLCRPAVTYDGLADAMFNTLRQNAERSASVLIHLVEVIAAVAAAEPRPDRHRTLRRHVDLAVAAARRGDIEPDAMQALMDRVAAFDAALRA